MALSREDILRGLEDDGLESSLDSASRIDPDRHAQNLDLAKLNNLPVDTVDRQLDEVKRRGLLNAIDVDSLRNSNPKTAKWLTNPNNSSVALDDLDILKGMEDSLSQSDRTWGGLGADSSIDLGKGIVGLGDAAVGLADILSHNAIGTALDFMGYDPERTKQMMADFYTGQRKRADRNVAEAKGFFNTLDALAENPSSAFGSVIESTPMMLSSASIVKGVAGKLLANAGLKIGTPEAAAFLARPDIIAKLTLASAGSEGAMTAGQIQETGRREGKSWSETVLYSLGGGFTTALISKLSSKLVPDVEVGLARATMGGGVKPELLQAGKEIAKSTLKEGLLEELPQSAQEQVFTNLALGKPWDEGVGEAAAQGLVVGTAMGTGMSTGTQAISFMNGTEREIRKSIKSTHDQEVIEQAITYAQSSTTNERAAGQFEDFVKTVGDRDVLIPNDVAMDMEDAPGYIIDQVNELGTDISIPLSKFASEIAKNDEWMALLRPHIKLSEGSFSQSEIEEGDRGETEALLNKAVQEKEVATESDRIYQEVKEQIVSTGMQSEQTARHSAAIYPAAVATYVEKAKRAGHDVSPQDIYEMMGFRMEKGKPAETAILNQPQIPEDAEIQMDLETIETGEIIQESFNAKELHDDINDRMDNYKRLLDCLG